MMIKKTSRLCSEAVRQTTTTTDVLFNNVDSSSTNSNEGNNSLPLLFLRQARLLFITFLSKVLFNRRPRLLSRVI